MTSVLTTAATVPLPAAVAVAMLNRPCQTAQARMLPRLPLYSQVSTSEPQPRLKTKPMYAAGAKPR